MNKQICASGFRNPDIPVTNVKKLNYCLSVIYEHILFFGVGVSIQLR